LSGIKQAGGEPVHHVSVSGCAQSRGDQMNIQQVGVSFFSFLALYDCTDDGVGGDLST
jgi:hypothetical protein